MINWLIIGVLLIIALYVIKIQHFSKKVQVIIVVIAIILVYFSATALLSANDIELNSVQGVGKAIYLYGGWMKDISITLWHAGGEIVTIVGNTIKLNQTEAHTKYNFKDRFKKR